MLQYYHYRYWRSTNAPPMPTNDKMDGVTLQLCNQLLLVVTSNVFVTFKIALTSNCDGTVSVQMGNRMKVASFFHQDRSKVTALRYISNLPPLPRPHGKPPMYSVFSIHYSVYQYLYCIQYVQYTICVENHPRGHACRWIQQNYFNAKRLFPVILPFI